MKNLKNILALNARKSSHAARRIHHMSLLCQNELMGLLGHAQSKYNPALKLDAPSARPLVPR